jgi:hypothetical protein
MALRRRSVFVASLALGAALLGGACPATAADPAPAAGWHFAIPSGWADLSPGQPLPESLPPQVKSLAQSGRYAALAIDIQGASGGFAENLNAVLEHHPLVANPASLERYVASVPSQAEREVQEAEVGVLEKSIVPIGGVPSFRVLIAIHQADGKDLRMLRYVIPGGSDTAALTFTATAAAYPKYLPAFEAAAQATTGAKEAPFLIRTGNQLLGGLLGNMSAEDRDKIFTLGGRILGLAVALALIGLYQRAKKRKQNPQ